MLVANLKEWVVARTERVVELRRHFHRFPEQAFEEHNTVAFVTAQMKAAGYECESKIGKTGMVATMRNGVGSTLMVRADMDGLPIDEQTGLDFAATNGSMHACGHDGHMAIAITVAEIMANCQQSWRGTLAFVFQPAEEIGAGAKAMLDSGLLNKLHPDRMLGLHIWNQSHSGRIEINRGLAFGGASMFTIKVIGKGGHGAAPETTCDPIPVAAQIITALQTVVSREVAPTDGVVLTIGSLHAGEAGNVIPAEVLMNGSLRARTPELLQTVGCSVRRIVDSIALAMRCSAELEFGSLVAPVINDPEIAEWVENIAVNTVGRDAVGGHAPLVGSEDVSEFLQRIPGAFFLLGGGQRPDSHHSPVFDFDENCLTVGVHVLAGCALDYLD